MINNYFNKPLVYASIILSLVGGHNLKAMENIRLYQESDHAVLRDIIAKNEELIINPDAEHQTYESRLAYTERFFPSKNYITKVYSKNNEPAGFITYQKEGVLAPFVIDFANFDPKKVEKALHGSIQILAVKEQFQRQGIGKALLNDAIEYAKSKNIKVIMVQTRVTNSASRALYEKAGFKLMFPIMPGMKDCMFRLVVE